MRRWQPPAVAVTRTPTVSPPQHFSVQHITVEPDDRSVTVAGIGGRPATERYPTAEVIESDQAVSFLAVRESTDFVGWVTAAGISVAVPARLARPLGKRVVVDLAGHAVPALGHPASA